MRRSKAVLLLSMLWVTGCNFNPTPPATNTSVLTKGITLPPGTNAILAIKSMAGSSSAAADGSTVELLTALIVLKEIKLREEFDDELGDDALRFDLEGPFLIDLMPPTSVRNLGTSNIDDDADDDGVRDVDDDDDDGDGVSDDDDDDDDNDGVPDEDDQTMGEIRLFDALELPAGTYRRIEFKLDELDAEDAPEPDHEMVGFSIRVTGSITSSDGATTVDMEYCASFDEELRFRSMEGIVVEPGIVATFLLMFDPAAWFAGVDPADGTLDEEGDLIICGDSNPALADIVRDNIHVSARLGRDEDGDGEDDDDDGDLEDDDQSNDDSSSRSTSTGG